MLTRISLLALVLSATLTATSAPAIETTGNTGLTLTGTMTYPRQEHTATLLANGTVLISGWDSETAELFDPATGTFSLTGATVANHRQGASATLLPSGKVLIAGGVNAQRVAELYDPATGQFSLTDSLGVEHSYHTATLLPDGKVLIAGGQNNAGPQTHAVAGLFDPATESFSMTDSLLAHRSSHTATLLPDDKVLITGGIQTTTPGSGVFTSMCEVYDPSTASFTTVPSMNAVRIAHTATLLGNGKVLISGGSWSVNTGEVFDPVAQTWSPTGAMTVVRRLYHTATLLVDGRVVLTGGSADGASPTVEVYDPATNTFTSRDTMSARRQGHAATRLAGGDVLLTGGYDGSAVLRSAEIIDGSVPTTVPPTNTVGALPASMTLEQNYPNPFNPSTTISYHVSAVCMVRIGVFDLLGREVADLVHENKEPGAYELRFTAAGLASGLYLCRMSAGSFVRTMTMAVVR